MSLHPSMPVTRLPPVELAARLRAGVEDAQLAVDEAPWRATASGCEVALGRRARARSGRTRRCRARAARCRGSARAGAHASARSGWRSRCRGVGSGSARSRGRAARGAATSRRAAASTSTASPRRPAPRPPGRATAGCRRRSGLRAGPGVRCVPGTTRMQPRLGRARRERDPGGDDVGRREAPVGRVLMPGDVGRRRPPAWRRTARPSRTGRARARSRPRRGCAGGAPARRAR